MGLSTKDLIRISNNPSSLIEEGDVAILFKKKGSVHVIHFEPKLSKNVNPAMQKVDGKLLIKAIALARALCSEEIMERLIRLTAHPAGPKH